MPEDHMHRWETVTVYIKGRGSLRTEAVQECQHEFVECDAVRVVPRTLVEEDADGR